MENFLLHHHTKKLLSSFVRSGNHALLLHGPLGAGKETVALAVAQDILGPKQLDLQPYFMHISAAGSSISIEKVRELHSFLQLKTTGAADIRRVIVIHGADSMTDEAQNALLKALEEPPADTIIILTATKLQRIKQTILSRVQQLLLERVTLADSLKFFKAYPDKDVAWAHALSDGQVGLMKALLEGKQDHVVAGKIDLAKKLITASAFERLCQVDIIAKDKDTLSEFLYACKRISISALESAAQKNAEDAVIAWHRRLSLVCEAEESLLRNVNAKLLLTDLFVQI